ncbi:hypothetical protein Tco_0310106, partial [Tanacetum coccineum]
RMVELVNTRRKELAEQRAQERSYVKNQGPAVYSTVPTGKDKVIVSADREKVIPAGRTILVLVVLCLLQVDSIVS